MTYPVVFLPAAELVEDIVRSCYKYLLRKIDFAMHPHDQNSNPLSPCREEYLELLDVEDETIARRTSRSRSASNVGDYKPSISGTSLSASNMHSTESAYQFNLESKSPLPDNSEVDVKFSVNNTVRSTSLPVRLFIRGLLVVLTAMFSTHVPCFSVVINLLGSCTLSFSSFVIPPLFHLLLVAYPLRKSEISIMDFNSMQLRIPTLFDGISATNMFYMDIILLILGSILTIVGTVEAVESMIVAYSDANAGKTC
jgi:hypothetical protein